MDMKTWKQGATFDKLCPRCRARRKSQPVLEGAKENDDARRCSEAAGVAEGYPVRYPVG